MLRQGYVVATHPEDHSVDLVMADDGARYIGVQVLTPNGSTRSGTVDMPAVPEKSDKWDITQQTGQDQIAMVAFMGRYPVVAGFLLPQINQMTFKDPKLRFSRHQSDVTSSIDGDGNMQLTHPSGAFVRMGESPDLDDHSAKNADASLAVDRNTGRKPYIRVKVPGSFDLQMSPDGQLTLTVEKGAQIQFGDDVTVKAPKVTIDAPESRCTGNLTVDGALTYGGGMTGSGGAGATATINGNVEVVGNLHATGSITDGQ